MTKGNKTVLVMEISENPLIEYGEYAENLKSRQINLRNKMSKILKLSIGVIVMSMLSISGCSKDSSSDTDPADAFVGSYTYTMTASALGTQTGSLTVTKTAANKISMLTTDGTPTPYTVSGNNITEDANQTADIPVSSSSTAVFNENSTGSLTGKEITINGTWSNSKYTSLTFMVVATKK